MTGQHKRLAKIKLSPRQVGKALTALDNLGYGQKE